MATNQEKKAYLLLAEGQVFEGASFGTSGTAIGEIVFTTGMTAYQETLTDPSYYGQLITQTFPLIGNYGVNDEDYESPRAFTRGYIVREYCTAPSNFRMTGDIDGFLKLHGVVGIHGIDTRRLTRILREYGVMNGAVTTEDVSDLAVRDRLLAEIRAFRIVDAVSSVTEKHQVVHKAEDAKRRVVLIDYGSKRNIIRELNRHGCDVISVPPETSAEEILALHPDGIMLSNGPGDPEENTAAIEVLRALIPYKIPMFGICLGHQLFALANGGSTEKLKYGHRGANQPVLDKNLNRTYVTSQNHGYAVVGESIAQEVGEVSHINANDGTCEGIRYKGMPAFTVQFHPEARGGPRDASYLFETFIALMDKEGN